MKHLRHTRKRRYLHGGSKELFEAARAGDLELVRALLTSDNVNYTDTRGGRTPLFIAAAYGHIDIVKLLLEMPGIDVNKGNKINGGTPLYIATVSGYIDVVKLLLKRPDIDVNKATMAGDTPLFHAALEGHTDIINLLLSDPRIIIDTNTRKATEQGLFEDDIISMIIPPRMWKGFTRSDVSIMNTVFETEAPAGKKPPAQNWSACPVCLKYTERSDACKYMKHDCSTQGGYYHWDLYAKFRDNKRNISWCTICGRICSGHRHYALARHDAPHILAQPLPGADVFAPDCILEGGGGIEEKVMRFRRLREQAKGLNVYVGEMTERDAYDSLVEETWNAPLQGKVASIIAKKLAEKKAWNIPAENFLPNIGVPAAANDVVASNAVRSDQNVASLRPIVHPEGGDLFDNYGPLVQLNHRQEDGTISNHPKPVDWITPQTIEEVVRKRMLEFAEPNFGYCWSYPSDCKARWYPDEIKDFVPADVYEEYRRKFNRKFAA